MFFRNVRTWAVMVASSVWHGVHPGYYLSLVTVSVVLVIISLSRTCVTDRLQIYLRHLFI
jgi:hypothetical protein